MSVEQVKEAFTRIAKMEHAGVSQDQIAQAFNLDVASLAEVQATDRYREELASIAAEAFDRVDVMDEGWDVVENLAMNKVAEHLHHAADPDYALKAAMVANKAVRRSKHVNEAIGVQPNTQAVIHVNMQFADKLQTAFVIEHKETTELKKKDDNFLAPKAVTQLLQKTSDLVKPNLTAQLEEEIGDLDLLSVAVT